MCLTSRRWDAPAVAEEVPALRRAVVAFAVEHGFGSECTADVALAVSEALTNVVLHAYRNGAAGPMSLEASMEAAGVLLIAIGDEGEGHRPNPDSPGLGLGIPIMEKVSDDLELPLPGRRGAVRMRFQRR